ncbi:MAG: hypothetical protein WD994_01190, partial [Pseudomonadales bacterium]
RLQATGVCVASAILPLTHWIGSAVVALVLLRRGPAEGAMLLMWTSLPLLAWYMVNGDASPLLVLAGVGILAMVLRVTVSWEITLASAVAVAAIAGFSYEILSAQVLSMLVEWYIELLVAMEQTLSPEEARQVLVGFFALGQAYAMVGALLLARWWQSRLYNPDGFGKEFRALRLSPRLSIGLVAIIALFFAVGEPAFGRWIPLLTVPLVISAIAFVHWLISEKNLGTSWLVTFYLVLFLLIQLLYPLLTTVALLDSWMNLRKKFGSDKPENEV